MTTILLLIASIGLVFAPLPHSLADEAATSAPPQGLQAPPKGLRVLTAGHSFHVWMPGILK